MTFYRNCRKNGLAVRVLSAFICLSFFVGCEGAPVGDLRSTSNEKQSSKFASLLDGPGGANGPVVIVGIDGPKDHGEVETGVLILVEKCIKDGRPCVVIVPEDSTEYGDPGVLCSRRYTPNSAAWRACIDRLKKCFKSGGKCTTKTYNPKRPQSLPEVIGDAKNPQIVCHHVPTSNGQNPIWNCPCDPSALGEKDPTWLCCFSNKCAETAGGGTPGTPNPNSVLTIDELKDVKLPQ